MRYEKPPLTFERQAENLISRGLCADKNTLLNILQHVNYYRLSGYLYPYKNSDGSFKAKTTFEEVWKHYNFDRNLRLLVLDAVEKI
jgi:abortive infection bacteriophage resistance protein